MNRIPVKLSNILGIALIIVGLALVGHYAWGKMQVAYYQQQLREDFEKALPEEPDEPEEPGNPVEEGEEVIRVIFEDWAPMRLIIPKINVDLMVLTGGVFDEDLLDKGPVHYEMSDLPSTESGNVAIAGHRAGRWGFFYYLHELEEGDRIYLYTGGYRFAYAVKDVFIIQPTDWSVIHTTEIPSITLTTCGPLNRPPTHRLVARAELEEITLIPRQ